MQVVGIQGAALLVCTSPCPALHPAHTSLLCSSLHHWRSLRSSSCTEGAAAVKSIAEASQCSTDLRLKPPGLPQPSPLSPLHPTPLLGNGDIRMPQQAAQCCSALSKLASSSFPVSYYQLNLAWRGFSPHIPLAHKRLKNQQNHCLYLKGGDQGEKNSMF